MGKAFNEWYRAAKARDRRIHPDNVLMPGMTTQEFEDILANDILGHDWYIGYSCNSLQARAEMAAAIIHKVESMNKPWWKRLFNIC